jgi:nucleotide-binding universal stress UspA family protein
MAADYPVAAAWLDQRQEDINVLLGVRQQAEEACHRNGITFDADHIYDDRFILESNVATRALYADLVLAGSGVRADAALRSIVVGAAAFDARTPILLMPKSGQASLAPKNVMLAWNSRAEAASAAKASMELLAGAQTAHVVLVDPDASYGRNGGEPGADIAAFLSRHGVTVLVEQLASGERRTEEVLRQHALELGCDMIIMGAYGHSRLRERIFGGVTASILEDCAVPVLLAR